MSLPWMSPRFQKPWVLEQRIACDLPGHAGHRWIIAQSFATEAEAVGRCDEVRRTSSPLESWRTRNREQPCTPTVASLDLFGGEG